ncbi:MAG: NRDE family protein [Pseudomonadota bacterium]
MCLVAVALDQNNRFPLVLASNREEFFDRPSARMSWWQPADGAAAILGGRDLQAGGTWLGLTAQGRLGVVTNVRDPSNMDANAPSRGEIVPLWLRGDTQMDRLWPQMAMSGYNGFNLVALDFAVGEAFWVNNTQRYPQRLMRGLYGLSNAGLNTPWPKVVALKSRVKTALADSADLDGLVVRLFEALTDAAQVPDEHLPSTGVPINWERLLSPAFVRSPDGRYGTRCSTLVITERINKRLVTHVLERSYSGTSGMALLRQVALQNWPPKHTAALSSPALRGDGHFETSDVSELDNHALPATPVPRKTRARSLIKSTGTRIG